MGGREKPMASDAAMVDDKLGDEPTAIANKSLSRDTVFQTLSNRRRRLTLRYLSGSRTEPVQLRALSEWIAAKENDISRAEVTYKQRKRVYTSLYQSHLPALHRDGIVEYNRARGTVSLTPTASEFEVYLETGPDTTLSWRQYWVGLGTVAVAVSTVSWLGLGPFGSVTGHGVAIVLSVLVLVSALVFAHSAGQRGS